MLYLRGYGHHIFKTKGKEMTDHVNTLEALVADADMTAFGKHLDGVVMSGKTMADIRNSFFVGAGVGQLNNINVFGRLLKVYTSDDLKDGEMRLTIKPE